MCIILDYKNSKFKHLIDDISYWSLIFLKFCKHGGYEKKKYNLIVNLSKFVSIKKTSSGVVTLVYNQVNLLLNFVQSLIILSLKKFRVVTHFFKGKKIIKFLNFIYNNNFFSKSNRTTMSLTWSRQCPQ